MKIGIDSRAAKLYRGTGIGTYTFDLISSFNKIDLENEYLLFMPNGDNLELDLKKNFKICNLNRYSIDNFWSEANIPNNFKGKSIDLYHVPQNGVGLPCQKTCPFVITLHDVIPLKLPNTVSANYLHIFNEELPNIIDLCDGIITVSNFSRDDISKTFNFPKSKIYVTYLAAEHIYRPLNKIESSKIIEKAFGIAGNFILYVGGFSPRKNIVGLIYAFKRLLKSSKQDIKLVIAGKKGPSFEKYKAVTEKLHIEDKVIYPGFIPLFYMPYLYNSASLFTYLSLYEGFGLPPLEAMASGVPVIASNLTSIPEILGLNSAILVNPYSEEEIFNALYRGLYDNDLRKQLIKNGLSLSQNFTWDKTAKDTIKIYKSICNFQ